MYVHIYIKIKIYGEKIHLTLYIEIALDIRVNYDIDWRFLNWLRWYQGSLQLLNF